jgi:GntR family transcriptional regulator
MDFNLKVEKNVPLRIKIADQLRNWIKTEYPEGGQIPSEEELSSTLGISRGTLRQALSILDEEGFIVRKHGSGTFINPHVLRLRVRADLPFRLTDLIENAGYQASVNVLKKDIQTASHHLAKVLQLEEGTETMLLTRIFFADQEPAIYIRDQFPTSLICQDYTDQDLNNFLFEFLGKRCAVKLSYTLSEVIPISADSELAQQLKVELDTPLLMGNDTHFDVNNSPVVHSQVFYKDQFIRFHIMRKYS